MQTCHCLPSQACVCYCHLVVITFPLISPEISRAPYAKAVESLSVNPPFSPLQKLSTRNSAGTRNQEIIILTQYVPRYSLAGLGSSEWFG